jgi:hypothetical protein
MATKTETRTGRCNVHGTVQATREVPGVSFPFFVYAVRKYLARRKPFVCPNCGAEVSTHEFNR